MILNGPHWSYGRVLPKKLVQINTQTLHTFPSLLHKSWWVTYLYKAVAISHPREAAAIQILARVEQQMYTLNPLSVNSTTASSDWVSRKQTCRQCFCLEATRSLDLTYNFKVQLVFAFWFAILLTHQESKVVCPPLYLNVL